MNCFPGNTYIGPCNKIARLPPPPRNVRKLTISGYNMDACSTNAYSVYIREYIQERSQITACWGSWRGDFKLSNEHRHPWKTTQPSRTIKSTITLSKSNTGSTKIRILSPIFDTYMSRLDNTIDDACSERGGEPYDTRHLLRVQVNQLRWMLFSYGQS